MNMFSPAVHVCLLAASQTSPLSSMTWQRWHQVRLKLSHSGPRYLWEIFLFFFRDPPSAFSSSTLLVGWQEEHPACKNIEWWGAGMISCLEQGKIICVWFSWCHYYPIISCFSKIQNGLSFWYWPTQVFLEKRPLNGCVCVGSRST